VLSAAVGPLRRNLPSKLPPTRFVRDPEVLLALRLTRQERDIALDVIHTDGVIEAARTLEGILKTDA
jgi:hypothetical protein